MSDDLQQQAGINILGRYKIVGRIGRGGMGDVWLCEDPRLNRQVAVKTLPVHNQQDQEFALRFEREAQAAAALHHPHILPVHDYGRQPLPNGNLITYIVMPYIRGGSLAQRLVSYEQKHAFMPAQEALDFLSQAAEAIDYAHSRQVIHRDIKPGNMLLRDDAWLLLADFGIARILTIEDRLTATGPGFGTPEYMAPEQAQGQAEPASDTYSLAVIAYQMFTGRLPFEADSSYAITIQHLTQPPLPPSQLNPDLSPAFEGALLQGLAKRITERPPSAQAFIGSLRDALKNTPFEMTYRKGELLPTIGRPLPSTNNQDEQETERIDPTKGTPAFPVTRRRFLLGGGIAALAAGGLATWAFSTRNSGQTHPNSKPVAQTHVPDGAFLTLLGHNYPVDTLVWAPQKHLLVSIASRDNWRISWDIDTLIKQPNTSPAYTKRESFYDNVHPLEAWSPNGKYLAMVNNPLDSVSQNVTLDLYATDSNTFIPGDKALSVVLPTHNTVYGVGWLQNTSLVTLEQSALSSKDQLLLRISDITQPQLHPDPFLLAGDIGTSTCNKIVVSRVSAEVAIGFLDGTVQAGKVGRAGNKTTWQSGVGPLKFSTDSLATGDSVVAVDWSYDGSTLVAINSSMIANKIAFWKKRDSNAQQLQVPTADANTSFSVLASNPATNNPGFATGSQNGNVYLWGFIANSSPIKVLNNGGITNPVSALAWSPDGRYLAASFANDTASILIWKI